MKIAFFTDTYEPQINGVVNSIKLFKKQLESLGHEVHIFCPGKKSKENIHAIASKKFFKYPEYEISFPSYNIIQEMKEIKPDVIHIHTPLVIGSIGTAIGKIFDIPVVMTYHTLLTEYFSYISDNVGQKELEFVEKYVKWFFKKADLIITPSKSIKKLLKDYGIENKISVLPTPLTFSKIKIKRKNKIPIILHVGRICKEKRIDIILKAFKKLLEKTNARLVITSDGPYKKELEKLVKELGINRKVKFTGYLNKRKLLNLYSKADLFITASDTETQGIVLLEALAAGCPVIARNALGFKDVIKNNENGILFNTEDELIKKMFSVLKNKKLASRLRKEGYKTIEKFDIDLLSKKLEKSYLKSNNIEPISLQRKLLYSYILWIGLICSWLSRKSNISLNSRYIKLYVKLLKYGTKLVS
jgi:glycosyltransferase involved in cell wall biosynthesis